MTNIWYKADEQLPPLDTFVLIYYSKEMTDADDDWHWTDKASRYGVAKLVKLDSHLYEWVDDDGNEELISPSHWTHLPEAPK